MWGGLIMHMASFHGLAIEVIMRAQKEPFVQTNNWALDAMFFVPYCVCKSQRAILRKGHAMNGGPRTFRRNAIFDCVY